METAQNCTMPLIEVMSEGVVVPFSSYAEHGIKEICRSDIIVILFHFTGCNIIFLTMNLLNKALQICRNYGLLRENRIVERSVRKDEL